MPCAIARPSWPRRKGRKRRTRLLRRAGAAGVEPGQQGPHLRGNDPAAPGTCAPRTPAGRRLYLKQFYRQSHRPRRAGRRPARRLSAGPFSATASALCLLFQHDLRARRLHADNGATRLVPGSYKRGHTPDPEAAYDDVIQLDARRGDIVIIHGATWHSSGANRTREERMILLGFFCRSFMKPQQDQFRLASPEVVERATPTLKRLLGFDSQSGMRA